MLFTVNGFRRTFPLADEACRAQLRIDPVSDEILTDLGRAAFFLDVGLVFVPEISEGGENGIGKRSAQAAHGRIFDGQGEFFQEFDVSFLALPVSNPRQDSSRAPLPSRQTLHLPQDSSFVNWMKNFATSTIQVSSSITIMPPGPIIEPACVRLS